MPWNAFAHSSSLPFAFFLGIDPATETGLAILDAQGKIVQTCSIDLRKRSQLTSQEENPNYFFYVAQQAFEEYFQSLSPQWAPLVAAMEHPKYMTRLLRYTSHVQLGICALWQVQLYRYQIPTFFFEPTRIKKSATGRGNAPKKAMVQAAQNLGYNGNNHNIADAIHIADYLRKCFLLDLPRLPQRHLPF